MLTKPSFTSISGSAHRTHITHSSNLERGNFFLPISLNHPSKSYICSCHFILSISLRLLLTFFDSHLLYLCYFMFWLFQHFFLSSCFSLILYHFSKLVMMYLLRTCWLIAYWATWYFLNIILITLRLFLFLIIVLLAILNGFSSNIFVHWSVVLVN